MKDFNIHQLREELEVGEKTCSFETAYKAMVLDKLEFDANELRWQLHRIGEKIFEEVGTINTDRLIAGEQTMLKQLETVERILSELHFFFQRG